MTKKSKKGNKILELLKVFAIGIIAGAVNGFFGAGGGLILVPLCKFVCRLSTKVSHATTLTCIFLMCLCSSVVYFSNKVFDFKLIAVCLLGSIFGSLLGTRLLKKLRSGVVDLIFSLVLIAAGIVMIVLR